MKERDVILLIDYWHVPVNMNLSTYHEVLFTMKSDLFVVEKQRKGFTLNFEL
jgi:hypothetical protein